MSAETSITWMPNVGNPDQFMVVCPIYGLMLTKDCGDTWYILSQAPKENQAVKEFFRTCIADPGCPFKDTIGKELQRMEGK